MVKVVILISSGSGNIYCSSSDSSSGVIGSGRFNGGGN